METEEKVKNKTKLRWFTIPSLENNFPKSREPFKKIIGWIKSFAIFCYALFCSMYIT